MATTTTHLSEPHAGAAQGGFARWWLDELRAALPRRSRRPASASPRAFLLRRYGGGGGGAIEVFRRKGGAAARVGALDLPPPLPAPAGAAAAPAAGPALLSPESRRVVELLAKRGAPVVLLLEENEGLLCADRLPAGAAGELDRIMPHRVDLLTPWPAARVRWGYRVLGAGKEDGQVEVLLGVAPRAVVDPTVARLAAYGVPVDAVDLIGEDGDPAGVDLLAARDRRGPPSAAARAVRRAGLLALVLLAAGGAALAGAELYRLHDRVQQRGQFLRALEERMADLPGLQARIEALRRDAGFVPAQQARTPSPVVVLEVLSRILPDSIWLDEVSLEGDELTLSGYAEDAAQVLPIVESSAHFAQVRFSAPSTRVSVPGPGGGTREVERFSLAARVAPLAEPAEP